MDTPFDATRYNRRYRILRDEQTIYRAHWMDIADFLAPRRGRYLYKDNDTIQNNGEKKHQHIINGTAFKAIRTLGAGLQGGLTSPARPWFDLSVGDDDLAGYTPVKLWCEVVRNRMLAVLAGSNFYASNHTMYEEVGLFGTAAMLIDEDFDTIINCRAFTIGEYVLALDSKYKPNTLIRNINMTTSMLLEKFGPKKDLPEVVQAAIDGNRWDRRWEVLHTIEPAAYLDTEKADYRGMPYHSCYQLKGFSDEGILDKGGYRTLPFVAPRWAACANDAYGSDCPGMETLGDVRQLQKMEDKKLRAIDKEVEPPMVGPTALKNTNATGIAGGITYLDAPAGQQGFTPAYKVQMNLQNIGLELREVEKRIQDFFFNDLFLAILGQTKDMTATEVAQRHEEKLIMLGPILERIQSESLQPTIDRTFSIMDKFGLIPPAPQEMQGQQLRVNYISTLAQAQKLIGTSGLQQFAQFVGAIAPMMPDVVDNIDGDKMVAAYADMTGVAPDIIRDSKAVAAFRAQKAQQARTQQAMEAAPGLAQAAKSASQAQLGNDNNALQVLTGRGK